MKKAVLALLVLFAGYFMLKDPTGFAVTTQEIFGAVWGLTENLLTSLMDVVRTLSDS